ncbi:MAG: NPCBM/NEW2 domain-containing protein [Pirellulaceae bacterium]|nr:NPCBM/NEW2 domain-containing protein [Pirellulaceae bacterium]
MPFSNSPAPLPLSSHLALHRTPFLVALLVVVSVFCVGRVSHLHAADKRPPARYAALLQSGQRFQGDELTEWHSTAGSPKLDGQELLGDDPFRWLIDRRLVPMSVQPPARVELFGGDVLPGRVLAYAEAAAHRFEPAAAHFVVEPAVPLRPPQPAYEPTVRVAARAVRRIVWQPSGRACPPGALLERDGRQVEFRAVRFGADFVEVLTRDGRRRIEFADLSELRMPARDFWQVYLEELATLAPQAETQLLALETSGGLRMTSSLDRLRIHVQGNAKDATRWYHGLQPAWSLDMLWVPHADVWRRTLLAPHEVPLTRLEPTPAPDRADVASSSAEPRTAETPRTAAADTAWRVDRNVRGGTLRSGSQDYGWGLGVQAESRLAFALPPAAAGFHSSVGLDRIVGRGGCIQARVLLDWLDAPPLRTSPILVGSEQTFDTGRLELPANARHLLLCVDMAHHNRPPGADPLTIRDQADWLDPLLELDARQLPSAVGQQLTARIPAWDGWSLQPFDGPLVTGHAWDELAPSPGRFLPLIGSQETPLRLTRRFAQSASDRWLVVAASRPVAGGPDVTLQVRINGQLAGETKVPMHNRSAPDYLPLVLPLADYAGQEPIMVEVIQSAAGAESAVAWRMLGTTEQLPMRYELFEDQAVITALPIEAATDRTEGQVEQPRIVDTDRASSGRAVLLVPEGATARLALTRPVPIRERPAWGEYRFLRIAIRKPGGGRVDMTLQSDGGEPRRYDAGMGDLADRDTRRLWGGQFTDQWVVITRDLYQDHGACDLTALDLAVPDGRQAEFDQIYLGRSPADFNFLPLPAGMAK